MSKTANRAAAITYADECRLREAEELRRQAIADDLAELERFRNYFLRRRKVWVDVSTLISVIDDQAERLTGRRDALWAKDARELS